MQSLKQFNCCLFIILLSSLLSCSSKENGSEQKNDDSFNSKKEEVTLSKSDLESNMMMSFSSQGEAILAFQKIAGDINWDNLASYNSKTEYGDNLKLSLNFGTRIADALVAIFDKNPRKIWSMDKAINGIGKQLGVSSVINEYKEQITDFITKEDWLELSGEIETLQVDVFNRLEVDNKDEMILFSSIGGWVEGLNIISGHLKNNYSKEGAEIIFQKDIVAHYLTQIEKMSGSITEKSIYKEIKTSLASISAIMNNNSDTLTQEDIVKIHELTSNLIKEIEK